MHTESPLKTAPKPVRLVIAITLDRHKGLVVGVDASQFLSFI